MTERKFTEVKGAKLVKWERKGEVVEGTYEGSHSEERKRDGDVFDAVTHTVTDSDGEEVNFYNPTDLEVKMRKVKVGDYIKVTFTSEQAPKKRGQSPQKIFKVEIAD